MSSSRLLGTAVGVALQNHEAIRNASAPVANAAGGAAQVIGRTIWKTFAVNAGLMVVWFGAFITSYLLTANNFMGSATFMGLFGVLMFLVVPSTIFFIEARRVMKKVAAKNLAHRVAAQREREQKAFENAQALALYDAQQEAMRQAHAQQQGQYFQTQQMPQAPQYR